LDLVGVGISFQYLDVRKAVLLCNFSKLQLKLSGTEGVHYYNRFLVIKNSSIEIN